ncbi:MAG: hypothetical protein M3O71_23255 [Bacteroidota bacterium]|nr:hypothetical protein [Bacteroidota bacterium]
MTLKTAFYAIIGLLIFVSASCNNGSITNEPVLSEIQRISSPDKKVDAVLVNADVDATTSTSSKIFTVKRGTKISRNDFQYAVFNSDHTNRMIKLSWAENKKLIVSFDKARIFNYTNFWESGDVDNYKYVVEVLLNCASKDHQLEKHDLNP